MLAKKCSSKSVWRFWRDAGPVNRRAHCVKTGPGIKGDGGPKALRRRHTVGAEGDSINTGGLIRPLLLNHRRQQRAGNRCR